MADPSLSDILSLCDLVLRLGSIHRVTMHPDGRYESDTTHTVMVALVAATLAPHEAVPLDPTRVLLFALVHDLVEAHAGDVDTSRPLDADARAAKDAREAEALERIRSDLAGIPWVAAAIEEYEKQESAEARFVHFVDKCMPRLTHTLNDGKALRRLGMSAHDLTVRNMGARRAAGRWCARAAPRACAVPGGEVGCCEGVLGG